MGWVDWTVEESYERLKTAKTWLTNFETGAVPFGKYPTKEKARSSLREVLKEKASGDTPLHVCVFHAAAKEEAKWPAPRK